MIAILRKGLEDIKEVLAACFISVWITFLLLIPVALVYFFQWLMGDLR